MLGDATTALAPELVVGTIGFCNFALARIFIAAIAAVRVAIADEATMDAVAIVAPELALRALQS